MFLQLPHLLLYYFLLITAVSFCFFFLTRILNLGSKSGDMRVLFLLLRLFLPLSLLFGTYKVKFPTHLIIRHLQLFFPSFKAPCFLSCSRYTIRSLPSLHQSSRCSDVCLLAALGISSILRGAGGRLCFNYISDRQPLFLQV